MIFISVKLAIKQFELIKHTGVYSMSIDFPCIVKVGDILQNFIFTNIENIVITTVLTPNEICDFKVNWYPQRAVSVQVWYYWAPYVSQGRPKH